MPQLRDRSRTAASQSSLDGRRHTTAYPKKCKSICPFLGDFIASCLQYDASALTRTTVIHQSYLSYVQTRTSDVQQLKAAASVNRFAKHLKCTVLPEFFEAGAKGLYKCTIRRVSRNIKRQPTFSMENVADYLAIPVVDRPIKFRRQFINPTLQDGAIVTTDILQNEIVCIYSGEVISTAERELREQHYAELNKAMVIFSLPSGAHIDPNYTENGSPRALADAPWTALNHSRHQPNVLTRPYLDSAGSYHVIMIAKCDISSGSQLFYDYQDRTKNIPDSVWLKN